MSRIDEALKRISGAVAEPRLPSILERFLPENAPGIEGSKVPRFPAGPRAMDPKPPLSKAPVPVVPIAAHSSVTPDNEPRVDHEMPVDEKLVDVREIANYVGFLGGSVRRHKWLGLATLCCALGLTGATAILLPRTYHVQAKLLAQRNAVMTALSNPGRVVPWDADAPTRSAAETVHRRDNIIAMIQRTDLMNEWERTRVPILKLKDWIYASVFQQRPTQDEKLDRLVGLVESRLKVLAGPIGEGTVTFDLEWPDAGMAFRLVEVTQQAFLDARQAAEQTAIAESIGILERYSETLNQDLSRTLAELQQTQAKKGRSVGVARTPVHRNQATHSITALLPPVPTAVVGDPSLGAELDDPELPRMKSALAAKRQEITNLEAQQQRQASELQAKLAQLTTVYTMTHPSVLSVQQGIAALSHEPPQLTALKAQADSLEAEYASRLAAAIELQQEEKVKTDFAQRSAAAAEPAPPAQETRAPQPPENPAGARANDDPVDFAAVRLRLELSQLQSVLERTDGARIELAVSRAAFKYRYTVISPAQLPRAPIRPNLGRILGAGFVASLLLALVAVVAKDLLSGRILERWQVEKQLGLPILGTLGTV